MDFENETITAFQCRQVLSAFVFVYLIRLVQSIKDLKQGQGGDAPENR
jgi:hypothetical protein